MNLMVKMVEQMVVMAAKSTAALFILLTLFTLLLGWFWTKVRVPAFTEDFFSKLPFCL